MNSVSEPPVVARLRVLVRALPPSGVDAALTVLVLVVQLWPFFSRANVLGTPWDGWGYLVVFASAAPLLFRRRAPVVALVASLIATACYDAAGDVPAQPIWYAGLVAMYSVAAHTSRRLGLAMLVFTVGGGLLLAGSSETALRTAVLFVSAYAIGRASGVSRAYAAALEERAVRLEQERRLEAERAAERERARIARDMHDILSHAVSLMVVQAEAGPVVVRSDPAKAERVFDTIASAGRDAMTQLRRMLSVLKETDDARAPQPTMADLPALAAQVSGAGLTVRYAEDGEARSLPQDAEVAAYRIVQEALTNTVKHAATAKAEVRLTWRADALTIEITDDGGDFVPSPVSGGHGLIGIRERAAACGGTADIGPREDSPGFRVFVALPFTTGGMR
ncbi:sensor histidine kinase [Amycolatopsis sp. NPDC054798]